MNHNQKRQKPHVFKMMNSPVGRLTLVATDAGLAASCGRTTARAGCG